MTKLVVALVLALAPIGSGFVSRHAASASSRRLAASDLETEVETTSNVPRTQGKSRALPWMERPDSLNEILRDGDYTLVAGDFGFDPLAFASKTAPFFAALGDDGGDTSAAQLRRVRQYRNAEIKHGRLAMLAAAGWPVSELFDGRIASRFGLQSDLVNSDAATGIGLAPSLLNGGLGGVSPVYWGLVLAAASGIELLGFAIDFSAPATAPGDFGFDPLGLYPQAGPFAVGQSLEERRCVMREQELTHGRTAMLAVLGFVVQEKLTGVPVVEETPQFFIPDAQALQAEVQFATIAQVAVTVLGDAIGNLLPH